MNNNSIVKHKIIYMRVAKVEPRHTFSIYLPTSLYQKLFSKAFQPTFLPFFTPVF